MGSVLNQYSFILIAAALAMVAAAESLKQGFTYLRKIAGV